MKWIDLNLLYDLIPLPRLLRHRGAKIRVNLENQNAQSWKGQDTFFNGAVKKKLCCENFAKIETPPPSGPEHGDAIPPGAARLSLRLRQLLRAPRVRRPQLGVRGPRLLPPAPRLPRPRRGHAQHPDPARALPRLQEGQGGQDWGQQVRGRGQERSVSQPLDRAAIFNFFNNKNYIFRIFYQINSTGVRLFKYYWSRNIFKEIDTFVFLKPQKYLKCPALKTRHC